MSAETMNHGDFHFRVKEVLSEPKYWFAGPTTRALRGISEEDIETGEHEGNHAEGLGGRHGEIKVQKTATTKGTTEIPQGIDPYTASVGAAAGAVETSEKPAAGFGHDMTIIDNLGVMSRNEAIRRAKAKILVNKPTERRKWGEIIASQRRIQAGEFTKVKEQAKAEVVFEDTLPQRKKELWHTFEKMSGNERELVKRRGGLVFDYVKKEVALAA